MWQPFLMDDAPVFAVVLPLGRVQVGVPLARESWPLHVTVVPGVRTTAGLDRVVGVVRETARRVSARTATVGEPAWFGPDSDIPVDLVDGRALRPVHEDLLDALETYADAMVLEPAYNREGYRAHVTASSAGRARRGEQLTFDTIAVALLGADDRADHALPVAVFDLVSDAARPVPGTMAAASVIAVSTALAASRVRHWLIGGWGVDALLGTQTREHHDLDLLVHADHVPALLEALRGLQATVRYVWSESLPLKGSGLPTAFVADGPFGELDVHVVSLDGDRPVPRWVNAPALPSGALGTGTIEGRVIPCVTAEAQLALHTGYDLPPEQQNDLERLRLGVAATPRRSVVDPIAPLANG